MTFNWKTTLAGFALAAANLIASGVNPKSALMSAGFLALGALAKDFDKSGKPPAA